jgi:uncharacterized protein (TIGR00730 family)
MSDSRMPSVAVFCASSPGRDPALRQAAQALGDAIARRGWQVLYGGSHAGLMGIVADAALAAGGPVVGVLPQHLVQREVAHPGLTELHVVHGMHPRKAVFLQRADAFLVLPGGLGTWDEWMEAWTWRVLGLHDRPIIVLDFDHYYAPIRQMVDRAVAAGLVGETGATLSTFCDTVGDALHQLDLALAPS